jgi:hypothetical protein
MVKKLCPICGTENTGGRPHTWHKNGSRKKKYTHQQITQMSEVVRERNGLVELLCSAVDIARQPDHWVRIKRGKATETAGRRD